MLLFNGKTTPTTQRFDKPAQNQYAFKELT
jgi:hypothetical protein